MRMNNERMTGEARKEFDRRPAMLIALAVHIHEQAIGTPEWERVWDMPDKRERDARMYKIIGEQDRDFYLRVEGKEERLIAGALLMACGKLIAEAESESVQEKIREACGIGSRGISRDSRRPPRSYE